MAYKTKAPKVKKTWCKVNVYLEPPELELVKEAQAYNRRKALSEYCRFALVETSRKIVADRRAVDINLSGMPQNSAKLMEMALREAEKDSEGKGKGKA